jgi:hypothetical protein
MGEIRQRGPVKLDASTYARPCNINAAIIRSEKAYRAALAMERLSDLVVGYQTQGDPRAVAAS